MINKTYLKISNGYEDILQLRYSLETFLKKQFQSKYSWNKRAKRTREERLLFMGFVTKYKEKFNYLQFSVSEFLTNYSAT